MAKGATHAARREKERRCCEVMGEKEENKERKKERKKEREG